jgi:hypothetical protein
MRVAEPTAADLLHLDVDTRLGAYLWTQLWEDEWDEEMVSTALRFAYGLGYSDALTENQRGKLCLDHGFAVPARGQVADLGD